MAKRTVKNQHTTAIPGVAGPTQFLKGSSLQASFLSNKAERIDRETGEIRTVDLNGALVRDWLDNQCWKSNQMVERIRKSVEEIARRAAYYERSYGSKEVQEEDLLKVAEQLEDAQMRLATVEEMHRLACKAYLEHVGKPYIPRVAGIPAGQPTVPHDRPMTPALARLAAAREAATRREKQEAVG